MTSTSSPLRTVAPLAADALGWVAAAVWGVADSTGVGDRLALVGRLCAESLGLTPLAGADPAAVRRWSDRPATAWRSFRHLSDADRALLAFAEQFSTDVSRVDADLRRPLFDHFGTEAGNLAAAVYVLDFLPRTEAALAALSGPAPGTAAIVPGRPEGAEPGSGGPELWLAFDAMIRTIPRLDALDPVTSELVRLRGARLHHCRLCASLRSRGAILGGADDITFDAVDHYRQSDLPVATKAALAFTDAMVWTPGNLTPAVVDDVRATLTPGQQVELVCDVTRNALNKVAVALGADAAHVEEGIEIYDIDDDGELVYGLTLD